MNICFLKQDRRRQVIKPKTESKKIEGMSNTNTNTQMHKYKYTNTKKNKYKYNIAGDRL